MTAEEVDAMAASYVAKNYTRRLFYRPDNGSWGAECLELQGCLSGGDTAQEAATALEDAMHTWLAVSIEMGHTIPEPFDLMALITMELANTREIRDKCQREVAP